MNSCLTYSFLVSISTVNFQKQLQPADVDTICREKKLFKKSIFSIKSKKGLKSPDCIESAKNVSNSIANPLKENAVVDFVLNIFWTVGDLIFYLICESTFTAGTQTGECVTTLSAYPHL